jgi:hypothetical protein
MLKKAFVLYKSLLDNYSNLQYTIIYNSYYNFQIDYFIFVGICNPPQEQW